jgi:hypothetical protein
MAKNSQDGQKLKHKRRIIAKIARNYRKPAAKVRFLDVPKYMYFI